MEHRIRLHTSEGTRVLTARTGDNLYQVLAAARVGMEAPCGGKGTCGKCRVTLVPAGEAGAEEAAFLGEEALARGERLSCRVTVNRDLEVTLKTAASARIMTAGRDAFTARCPYRWEQVTLPLPSLEDPLDDESRLLSDYGIRVIGYDDLLMGQTDDSLYTLKSQAFNVIVAHEPVIAQKIESSSQNLVLTGHTHGGQVTIPVLTDRLLPAGSGEFRKGFYDAQEIGTDADLQMYTSSGIGMTRYPFRFLNAPEIVEINVHAA